MPNPNYPNPDEVRGLTPREEIAARVLSNLILSGFRLARSVDNEEIARQSVEITDELFLKLKAN